MKMWSGRFSEENAKEVDEFNNSLKFDINMIFWEALHT